MAAFAVEAKISVFGIWPDATVLLAYFIGLRYGPTAGAVGGAAVGFFSDGLAAGYLGPNVISKCVVGYFSAFFSSTFFGWTPYVGMLGTAGFTILDRGISFMVVTALGQMPLNPSSAVKIILWQAAINTVLGAFIWPKDNE